MDTDADTALSRHNNDVHIHRGNSPGKHHDVPMSDNGYNRDGHAGSGMIGDALMKPVFFGNLSAYCNAEDIEEIFHRPVIDIGGPIPVDRVDLKRGFCFIFLLDAKTQDDKDRVERYVTELNGM